MLKKISNQVFDEERSLYNLKSAIVQKCLFSGPKDGESVLKEARKITVKNCEFCLRYPMWHVKDFVLSSSSMDEKGRAPLWYAQKGVIESCKIDSIKCLRECKDIKLVDCKIKSPEFGWRCKNLNIISSCIEAEYFLFESQNIDIENLKMSGKYSFQYMKNLHIKNSVLDTKDAFWHSKNVVVENSIIKGEYLGWFSNNLTLINCKIIGTQPLCYCKNLKLINCEMENTDLAFEYSEVDADIKGSVFSIKNPKSGTITADEVGEVIFSDAIMNCKGKVVLREKAKCCA